VSFCLNTPFPPPKYIMSPIEVNDVPHQSGSSPELNHYRSPSQVPLFPGQNKKRGKKQWSQLFYPFKGNIIR
jgi:hypothetical protein